MEAIEIRGRAIALARARPNKLRLRRLGPAAGENPENGLRLGPATALSTVRPFEGRFGPGPLIEDDSRRRRRPGRAAAAGGPLPPAGGVTVGPPGRGPLRPLQWLRCMVHFGRDAEKKKTELCLERSPGSDSNFSGSGPGAGRIYH